MALVSACSRYVLAWSLASPASQVPVAGASGGREAFTWYQCPRETGGKLQIPGRGVQFYSDGVAIVGGPGERKDAQFPFRNQAVSPGGDTSRSKREAAPGPQDCSFGKHGHRSHPSAVSTQGLPGAEGEAEAWLHRSACSGSSCCHTSWGLLPAARSVMPWSGSAGRDICQGEGSWQKPVNPSAQTSRDPAGPPPALMVGQIKSSALQVAHKKRLKQHSQ